MCAYNSSTAKVLCVYFSSGSYYNDDMKVLIFGENGQLARHFTQQFVGVDVSQFGREKVDFLNPSTVEDTIRNLKPTHIINTAAYTAVDKAESDRKTALQVNGEILKVIGAEAKRCDAKVVHFSTDYVFNGEKASKYTEEDSTDPVNYYGYTKLVGEKNLLSSECKCLIFRISWIYSEYGKNFLKAIVNLAETKEEMSVVNDQFGAPTSAFDIASAVAKITQSPAFDNKTGVFHLVAEGRTSWFNYAEKIVEMAKSHPDKFRIVNKHINPITSNEFVTAAKRPLNSTLNTEKFKNTFGFALPNWEKSLLEVFKTL